MVKNSIMKRFSYTNHVCAGQSKAHWQGWGEGEFGRSSWECSWGSCLWDEVAREHDTLYLITASPNSFKKHLGKFLCNLMRLIVIQWYNWTRVELTVSLTNTKSVLVNMKFCHVPEFCWSNNEGGEISCLTRELDVPIPMMSRQDHQLSEPPLKRAKTGVKTSDISNLC